MIRRIYLARAFNSLVAIGVGISLLVLMNFAAASTGLIVGFIVALVPTVLLLLCTEWLEIDIQHSRYRSVIRLLGLSFPKRFIAFTELVGVQIVKSKMTKTMQSRTTASSVSYDEFDAYLVFSDTKYYLFSDSREEKLRKRLGPVLSDLNLQII